jgi:hypothetical protein
MLTSLHPTSIHPLASVAPLSAAATHLQHTRSSKKRDRIDRYFDAGEVSISWSNLSTASSIYEPTATATAPLLLRGPSF